MLRRPPIPVNRIASLAAVASAGGVIGGTVVRANAHIDFFRNLDNRPAFFQAIDNIQYRLGERPPSERTNTAYSYPGSDNENQETADSATSSRGTWEETTVDVDRATLGPNSSIVTHPTHLYNHLSFCVPQALHSLPNARAVGTRSGRNMRAARPHGLPGMNCDKTQADRNLRAQGVIRLRDHKTLPSTD
jgi:hypothetical protein